jgi:hypothetical protein
MRILLRQPETGLFLQPTGEWTANRETAREFGGAVNAYLWASERGLFGTEVWLALIDPLKDFVCIRVQGGKHRPVINCQHPQWNHALHSYLFDGVEVDLHDFDFGLHGEYCKTLSQSFMMDFTIDLNRDSSVAHFRKQPVLHSPMKPPG